jgi:hypothetical protein
MCNLIAVMSQEKKERKMPTPNNSEANHYEHKGAEKGESS